VRARRFLARVFAALAIASASPVLTAASESSPDNEVLTLDEAASLLRIDSELLRVEAEAQRVPGRRIGTEWRFARTALLEWLAGGSAPSVPAGERAALTGRGSGSDEEEPPAPIGEPPELETAEEVSLRDQQILLRPGDLVVEPSLFYTRSDSRLLSISLGLPTSEVLDLDSRSTSSSITARYGLLHETELLAAFSYERERRRAQFSGEGVGEDTDELRFLSLGLRRTLLHERSGFPSLVLSLGSDVPIANTSPAVSTGIAGVSSLDPIILFGGIQYRRAFARAFDDAALLEHDHNIAATFGYAFALNDELTLNMSLLGVFGSATTFHGRFGASRTELPVGTDSEIELERREEYYLRVGMTRMLAPGRYVEPTVSFLLNGNESKVTFGINLPWLIGRGDR
jgi:excisionase family DNA binding protein